MEYTSIFEVDRNEYKGFVNEIKPEYRDIKIEQINKTHTAIKTYSKKTGKCLCSRVAYTADYDEKEPEKYYIFEMPDNDERGPGVPVFNLKLETKEEVQAFFDFLAQKNKEKNND